VSEQDREHVVKLSGSEVATLRQWLLNPNGSLMLKRGRVTFESVEGCAVMVRTQPFRYVPPA